MAILENIIDGVCIAKEKITETAQSIVETSKKNAQLNRLRNMMKRENETMAKAYQALGKIYYEKMTDEEMKENQLFCQIINQSHDRLERAHKRYIQIEKGIQESEKQVRESITPDDLDSLTVACSNSEEYNAVDATPKEESKKTEEGADEDSF